ncbi:MAG: LacI family DNA-binding transcriptional regulator [Capsulimonadaceae bacterium]
MSLPMDRAVTLQDVADRAGVSRATASSVLNGLLSTARASVATQQRVRQAAVELGYGPNAVARSLRHRVTLSIGFYNGFGYIDARNPFLSAVIAGMHAGCDIHSYDLLIHRVGGHEDANKTFLEIVSGKVDGVILYTQVGDPLVDMIAARRFPAVALADAHPQIPSVTADDAGGSRLVAHRLAARGHKHILYRMPSVERVSANNRRDGFLSEARHLGLHVYIGMAANYDNSISSEEVAILAKPEGERPTAIAGWSDGSALSALDYLEATGRIGQIAVIGFDGFELPRMPAKLTTVLVPWDRVALAAVDAVYDLINGKPVGLNICVPSTLIDGETG